MSECGKAIKSSNVLRMDLREEFVRLWPVLGRAGHLANDRFLRTFSSWTPTPRGGNIHMSNHTRNVIALRRFVSSRFIKRSDSFGRRQYGLKLTLIVR